MVSVPFWVAGRFDRGKASRSSELRLLGKIVFFQPTSLRST
jgi:hypothetical protein